MSRRRPLKSLGDWIGTGGHHFANGLLENATSAPTPVQTLPITHLTASRYQPRQKVDEMQLAELVRSVRQFGVIEPVVVRPLAGGRYEILAGHRRWHAAQQAGLTEIPVVVREADERTAAVIGLIENLLRQALNPIEEGRALWRLREEFGLTQEQLAELLGISQTAISRALGLLSLEPAVQAHIAAGRLEAGHGKTLLGLPGALQIQLAEQAVTQGWSVRELERRRAAMRARNSTPSPLACRDPNVKALEEQLRERLAAPVRIRYDAARNRGCIEITFTCLDECEGILERLGLPKTGEI